MILNKAIRSISFDYRQILLFSTNLNAFFKKKEFTASITKTGEMTQRYPKSYFSVLIWGWKYANSIHMGLSFKSHFKQLPIGSEVSSRPFRTNL